MEKLYKIDVLRVQGLGKKTYTPNTKTKHGIGIVSSDMFPEGNAEALAKSGHLIEIQEKKAEKPVEKPVEKTDKTVKK